MKRIFLQTIMAAAVFLSACNKNENPAGAGLPDGEEVKTINVTIREPESNTRVGVDVDDANKVDKYHWIDGDKIWLLEVNAAGDAFTGQRYEYTYVPTSSNVNGAFFGRGAVIGRNYVPVHIRKDVLMVWPAADDKHLKFNMSTFTQTGLWTDPGVQQALVDQLLFVGAKFTMRKTPNPGPLIVLKHTLTQVEVALTAKYSYDEGRILTSVVLNCSDNSYASNLSIGVLGTVDETICTWGKQSSTTTFNNVSLSQGESYLARVLLYQKKGTQVQGTVIAGNGESAPTTAKELSVGKVYKLKSPLTFPARKIIKPDRNMLATQRIVHNGVHELKFDFKNSEYNKLKVRVTNEQVNTAYGSGGITDTKVEYLTPGGADGIELTWPATELKVTLPQNNAVNLLRKITVEYLDTDASGNMVWKGKEKNGISPMIYQDGQPFSTSPKPYLVRYYNYFNYIYFNGTEILEQLDDENVVKWLAAALNQTSSDWDLTSAIEAVRLAKLPPSTLHENTVDINTSVKVTYNVLIRSRAVMMDNRIGELYYGVLEHKHPKAKLEHEDLSTELPHFGISGADNIWLDRYAGVYRVWTNRIECSHCKAVAFPELFQNTRYPEQKPSFVKYDELPREITDISASTIRAPAVRLPVTLSTTGDVCVAETK